MRFPKYPDSCGRGLNYLHRLFREQSSVHRFTTPGQGRGLFIFHTVLFTRNYGLSFIWQTQHHLNLWLLAVFANQENRFAKQELTAECRTRRQWQHCCLANISLEKFRVAPYPAVAVTTQAVRVQLRTHWLFNIPPRNPKSATKHLTSSVQHIKGLTRARSLVSKEKIITFPNWDKAEQRARHVRQQTVYKVETNPCCTL